jgi:hypothetical protein
VSPLKTIQISGPWQRLHRAESSLLAGLLSFQELDAVNRRLGLPSSPQAWIPASAGDLGGRFALPHGPGALYLGQEQATCINEVIHHHALHCRASLGTPPGTRAVFQHLVFQVSGTLADASVVRGGGLHDPLDYAPSWAYGHRVRSLGLAGVHYRSVRHRGGRCLAVFENRALRFLSIVFGAVVLEWDGSSSRRIA